MYKILESSGRQVKEAITNKTAQILATYRKHCASPSSAGQLILPECMKLMPLYVNCLIKCDAMSGGMLFILLAVMDFIYYLYCCRSRHDG